MSMLMHSLLSLIQFPVFSAFQILLLVEALTRKLHCSANNSELARNICVKLKLVLPVFLGKNKLLRFQDIIYWSLILRTKQVKNIRDIKEQTAVVAYFAGGDFLSSISFGE